MGVLGILLAGCASSDKLVSVREVGSAFPHAQYQVLGQTRYDQTWIDKTIEAEVVGFNFPRPARRPASLAPKKPKPCPVCAKPVSVTKPAVTESTPLPQSKPEAAPPPKKKLFQRLKERFQKKPAQ